MCLPHRPRRDGETCSDIDECVVGTFDCDTNAVCTNTTGDFSCACHTGYEGDGVTCSGIDECTVGTGNCDTNALCTNTAGGFTCACHSWRLLVATFLSLVAAFFMERDTRTMWHGEERALRLSCFMVVQKVPRDAHLHLVRTPPSCNLIARKAPDLNCRRYADEPLRAVGLHPRPKWRHWYRSGQQEVHQHYWPEEPGVAARLVNSRTGRTSLHGVILARILKAPEPTTARTSCCPTIPSNQHSVRRIRASRAPYGLSGWRC